MDIGNPIHLMYLAAIALVVLGPKRLPELARSLGSGMRQFREAMDEAGAPPAERVVEEHPVGPPQQANTQPQQANTQPTTLTAGQDNDPHPPGDADPLGDSLQA